MSPRRARKNSAAPSAAPRPSQIRAATSATPAASMISIGWKTIRNCGTPKSNSAWKVESPSNSAPGSEIAAHERRPTPAPSRVLAPPASTNSTASPISVIAAPPISIRCVGPHSVTSWPNSRCQTSSSGKPISANVPAAAISTPPSGAYQPGATCTATRDGLLQRQAHRQEARREHAEQPGEDEVVRDVGQRPLVAALRDVQGDVPQHPEQRGDQRDDDDPGRDRQPTRAARRRARSSGPSRPSSATFPLRWPIPSHSSTTVTTARRRRSRSRPGPARRRPRAWPGRAGRACRRMYRRLTSRSVTSDTLGRVLTIDELARETGLTVRNVRSHHARGLLQPPEVRGRTGFYGPEHVERLRLIQRLQARRDEARAASSACSASPGSGCSRSRRLRWRRRETPEVVTARDARARGCG